MQTDTLVRGRNILEPAQITWMIADDETVAPGHKDKNTMVKSKTHNFIQRWVGWWCKYVCWRVGDKRIAERKNKLLYICPHVGKTRCITVGCNSYLQEAFYHFQIPLLLPHNRKHVLLYQRPKNLFEVLNNHHLQGEPLYGVRCLVPLEESRTISRLRASGQAMKPFEWLVGILEYRDSAVWSGTKLQTNKCARPRDLGVILRNRAVSPRLLLALLIEYRSRELHQYRRYAGRGSQ